MRALIVRLIVTSKKNRPITRFNYVHRALADDVFKRAIH